MAPMKTACYRLSVVKLRTLVFVLAAALVGSSTTVDAHADAGSAADAGDAGSACSSANSEVACLAIAQCVWGDQGAGPVCSLVGVVNAQPGSGDPGGGGAVATGEAADGGCTMSARSCPATRGLVAFAALGFVVAARRRRRAGTSAP
jgi:hypothetical protein